MTCYAERRIADRLFVAVFIAAFLGSCDFVSIDACANELSESSGIINPIAQYPLDQLTATRDRPLFSPTRRPARIDKPVAIVTQTPPPAPNMMLVGIVLDGSQANALVQIPPKPGAMRLHIGDVIMGWKITQIEAQRLVIAWGDRSMTFRLFDKAQSNHAPSSTAGGGADPVPNVKRAVPPPAKIPQSLVNGISFHP
jgi:general secretion pathway protein N